MVFPFFLSFCRWSFWGSFSTQLILDHVEPSIPHLLENYQDKALEAATKQVNYVIYASYRALDLSAQIFLSLYALVQQPQKYITTSTEP